jgi:superfamily II DNA/RNA helicase
MYTEEQLRESIAFAANKFGFKPKEIQEQALLAFLRGRDLLLVLPTGSGKSFIFQGAPFCFDYLHSLDKHSGESEMSHHNVALVHRENIM